MTHAIRIHETGGPEKLVWEDIPLPAPKAGEALVRHKAVGLNFIDVYFRTGLYKAPSLPAIIGMEGAGIVEAVGEGVLHDEADGPADEQHQVRDDDDAQHPGGGPAPNHGRPPSAG